jgi:hypothetical protein
MTTVDTALRLEQVIRVLQAVEADAKLCKHFDLATWAITSTGIRTRSGLPDVPDPMHQCGTTACAIGFCGLDGWFNSMGFTLNKKEGIPEYKARNMFEQTGWTAVEHFFDLSAFQAEYLFSSGYYSRQHDVTPAVVANRIRDFIDAGCPSIMP